MNTNREIEQIVRTWLDDRAADPPHASLASAMAQVATTPQQRRRWLGRWLDRGRGATRGAGDRGDTDRHIGRNRTMIGITAVTAGAAALTLAAALVVPRGDSGPPVIPAAGGGATHVVAADGSGDYTTISEAVAAAAEGDTVLVAPGEYAEVVLVDKDMTLQGDGPRDKIVVSFPAGSGPNEKDPDGNPFYATLKVADAKATISGLTVAGAVPESGEFAVNILVAGGAPLLEDTLVILSDPELESALPIIFAAGATPVIRESTWSGYLYATEGAAPTVEANTIIGVTAIIGLNGPAAVVVRGNTFQDGASISASGGVTGVIEGNDFTEGFIGIDNGSDMLVEANTMTGLSGSLGAAIYVRDSGSKAHVVGNAVTDAETAISVIGGADAIVEDNGLVDDTIGIAWSSTAPGTIDANTISGGVTGIVIGGGSPVVSDNSVTGATKFGISIGSQATPQLSGNTVCGNGLNLMVAKGATPVMGQNDICPDEPAPSAG